MWSTPKDNVCFVADHECPYLAHAIKKEKAVYIVTPSECTRQVEIVKKIVGNAGYEPIVATDEPRPNESVFCTRICSLIMQAPIVVVIGDWEKRKCNACVAFEYGMATALGAEIIPIWTKGETSGFFDVRGLGAIIIDNDSEEELLKLEDRFSKVFNKAVALVEGKKFPAKLIQSEQRQLESLFKKFGASTSVDEKNLLVNQFVYLRDLFNYYRFYQDSKLIQWTKSVLNDFAQKGTPQDFLGAAFFEHLGATVSNNCNVLKREEMLDDDEFHRSLSTVVLKNEAPQYAREKCIQCLVVLSAGLNKPSLFRPILELAKSEKVTDGMYESLGIPNAVRQYVDNAYHARSVPVEVLDFVLASNKEAIPSVRDRIHKLGTVFRRP